MIQDNEQYHKKAKRLVAIDFNDKFFYTDSSISSTASENEFYVTWFAKVLGNWKAMVSTDLVPNQCWEVTYNGAEKEAYVDHYDKVSNHAYSDAGYDRRYPVRSYAVDENGDPA